MKRMYTGPKDFNRRNPYVVVEYDEIFEEWIVYHNTYSRKRAERWIDETHSDRARVEVLTRYQWNKDPRNPKNK